MDRSIVYVLYKYDMHDININILFQFLNHFYLIYFIVVHSVLSNSYSTVSSTAKQTSTSFVTECMFDVVYQRQILHSFMRILARRQISKTQTLRIGHQYQIGGGPTQGTPTNQLIEGLVIVIRHSTIHCGVFVWYFS